MSLSRYQHSQLRRIEASLRRSDPKLAGMLGTFGRRCAGQRMPTWEQAPTRLDRIRQAAALLAKAATAIAAAIRLLLAAARLLAAAARALAAAVCKAAVPGRGRLRRGAQHAFGLSRPRVRWR